MALIYTELIAGRVVGHGRTSFPPSTSYEASNALLYRFRLVRLLGSGVIAPSAASFNVMITRVSKGSRKEHQSNLWRQCTHKVDDLTLARCASGFLGWVVWCVTAELTGLTVSMQFAVRNWVVVRRRLLPGLFS